MFLDMSGTGEPHRGLGRLFVRKGTRWPHLFIRTAWSGDGMTPHAQEPTPVHSNRICTASAARPGLPSTRATPWSWTALCSKRNKVAKPCHSNRMERRGHDAPCAGARIFFSNRIVHGQRGAPGRPCAPSVPRCFYLQVLCERGVRLLNENADLGTYKTKHAEAARLIYTIILRIG